MKSVPDPVDRADDSPARDPEITPAYRRLVGWLAVVVLLQALWAGFFLERDGQRDNATGWVYLHAVGAGVAILLAGAATAVAYALMRTRRDLLLASGALTALLLLQTYLGSLIRGGQESLTAVHVPLALGIMGLAAWLVLRVRRQV